MCKSFLLVCMVLTGLIFLLLHYIIRWWGTEHNNTAHKLLLHVIPKLFVGIYGRIDLRANMVEDNQI